MIWKAVDGKEWYSKGLNGEFDWNESATKLGAMIGLKGSIPHDNLDQHS